MRFSKQFILALVAMMVAASAWAVPAKRVQPFTLKVMAGL